MSGKSFFIVILIVFQNVLNAQSGISGVYEFHKTEMTAAFRFMEAGTFEFFYSYGASDRNASGKYEIKDQTILLQSDKVAGKDFTIGIQSKKTSNTMIQVKSPHTFLLSGVVAICVNEGFQTIETRSDNDGKINMEGQKCEKIYLNHVYFPDVPTLIKDSGNTNTYFEVTPLESLAAFSFTGINLTKSGEDLLCLPNVLFPFENNTFKKVE